MRRRIPSTAALTAFEAAARHRSYTLAADELHLTQSAIGRQIANLEEMLAVQLFRRTRRGVDLTPAGAEYAAVVRRRLDEIERDTLAIVSRGRGRRTIDLAVVPTFATHWLIPRLPRFAQAHPDLDVHLHVRTRPFLFQDSELDAAIHAGEGGWPGTRSHRLMSESMQVVCAPSLLGRRKRLRPAEMTTQPLIQMTTRPYAWRRWYEQHGLAHGADTSGMRVELFSMAVEAAVAGLGLALIPDYLARNLLFRKALVAPVQEEPTLSGLGYHLIYPDAQDQAGVEALHAWLAEESRIQ